MAASPKYKIFNPQGLYIASCKYIVDAAVLIAFYGHGAEIRTDHSPKSTVWREGAEAKPASESYDFVLATVAQREEERFNKQYIRNADGTVSVRSQ